MKRILTFTAILLLVVSVVGPPAVAGASSSGMVGVPDSNIHEDLPAQAQFGLDRSALTGSVMASSHAETLEVTVTTRSRAQDHAAVDVPAPPRGPNADPELALIFADNESHAGRTVAIPKAALRDQLGYLPDSAFGYHDSGDEWTAPISSSGELVTFRIPKFSSNVITFTSTAVATGTGQDGSTVTYNLSDLDGVSDPVFNLTGTLSTETDTITASAVSGGSTIPADIAGNLDPVDGSVTLTGNQYTGATYSPTGTGDGSISVNGDAAPSNQQITFEGRESSTQDNYAGTGVSLTATESISVDGNLAPTDGSGNDPLLEVTGHSGSITHSIVDDDGDGSNDIDLDFIGDNADGTTLKRGVELSPDSDITADKLTFNFGNIKGSQYGATADIYISQGASDDTFGDGTLVKSGWSPSWSSGEQTVQLDSSYTLSGGTTYTIDIITQNSDGDSTDDTIEVWTDDSPSSAKYWGADYTSWYKYADITVVEETFPTGVSVSDGAGHSHTFGDFADGETKSTRLNLDQSSTALDFSGSDGGTIDYSLTMVEHTATEDPSVDVNGDATADASYSGILTSGQTTTQSLSGLSTGSNTIGTSAAAGPLPSWTVTYDEELYTSDPAIDIDGDGTAEVSTTGKYGPGATYSGSISPTLNDDTWTVHSAGGPVDVEATVTERVGTQDPGVKFNSNWINHSGTLADGETVSYTGNSSWIQEGTNTVEIALPELSADAPTPKVGFEVSHEASSEITTEYAADAWQESYNVSTTFSATKENPSVEIPFSGTVYRVPYVEESVNGSSWTTIPSDRYSWDGSTLTIQLDDGDGDGDVDANTDYAVRVAGQRMDVQNGQVTVTDPIAPGDDLDVGVRIDQKDAGFRIGVGGTQSGHLIHYPYQESWSNPAGQAIVESGGVQYLELPNAPEGGTFRVTTTPLEVAPDTGAASVTIDDPDGPVFKIGPGPDGPGDDLTIKYHGASSGNTYDLYSRSRTRDVGTDTAESPAIFEEDDSEEIFEIQLHEDSGGGGGGGGGGFPAPTPDTPLSRYGIVAGWALLVVLLAYGTGKSDMDDRTRWALLGITTVGGGILTLEVLNPGSVSTALGQAIGKSLEELLPLAGLAGIGIGAYSIYMWWKRRQTEAATPETQVAFNLRGDSK